MINGIDVASYQGDKIPTNNIDFMFIKATEGTTYVNPDMEAQAKAAREAGIPVGFYHFLHPGFIAAQMSFFAEQCDSVLGDMLAIDWEVTGAGNYASGAEKDQALTVLRRLRPHHHRIGLYCSTSFWLGVDKTSQCGDFLWIAAPDVPHPPIEHPWLFWQKGERGGIDSDVGAFFSRKALRAWCEDA